MDFPPAAKYKAGRIKVSSTVQTIEKKSSVKNGVGRLVLTAVSVILEAAVIIIIALRLNSYAEWIAIGTRILAALLVLAIYARNTTSAMKKLPENREVLESLQDKSGYLANIARYVQDKAGYPVYRNTDIVYYDDAAAALAAQKEELKKRRNSFLWSIMPSRIPGSGMASRISWRRK